MTGKKARRAQAAIEEEISSSVGPIRRPVARLHRESSLDRTLYHTSGIRNPQRARPPAPLSLFACYPLTFDGMFWSVEFGVGLVPRQAVDDQRRPSGAVAWR